jgi:hypothetical protein
VWIVARDVPFSVASTYVTFANFLPNPLLRTPKTLASSHGIPSSCFVFATMRGHAVTWTFKLTFCVTC